MEIAVLIPAYQPDSVLISLVQALHRENFRLIVMEVFQNKKQKKNREIYMKWKDLVRGDVFFADRDYRPVKETKKDEAEVRVVRMWNPSYRVNNGQYVSLEEYLKEFKRRLSGKKEKME